jgi:hypothetical protein
MLHFRESCLSDGPSLREQINFYLHFPYFLTDLDQIWCEGYSNTEVENS